MSLLSFEPFFRDDIYACIYHFRIRLPKTCCISASYTDLSPSKNFFSRHLSPDKTRKSHLDLQTATGRTDIGLKWTIYLIASTAVVYYSTSYFGIIYFLCGICLLTLMNVFMVWFIQFKPMVKVSITEYLSIYTLSFVICFVLSVITYIIYSNPSLPYTIVASVLFLSTFAILILKSRDGADVLEALKLMKAPNKVMALAEKIK